MANPNNWNPTFEELTVTGNVTFGDVLKDSQSLFRGRLKIDERPTGGTTEDYALQIRSESGKTSGTHWGIDSETHLKATGTASLRGVQGVAVLDATFTSTGGTFNGVYGQVRIDGTYNAPAGFLNAGYFLQGPSTALTVGHLCSVWLDSQQANTVTGSHQLAYMTNNGAAQMDEVFYIYGGDKITSLMELDTVGGMVSDTAETGGTSKKIKITIDGVVHYLNAYTG